MKEEWKAIKGYEGLYSISSKGRVRRESRIYLRNGKPVHLPTMIMSTPAGTHGYKCFNLRKKGKSRTVCVHVIVAETFIGPCPVGQEVRHINGIKLDCNATNVEYGTRKTNNEDKQRHGTTGLGSRSNLAKINVFIATMVRLLHNTGYAVSRISKITKLPMSTCCNIYAYRCWDARLWLRDLELMNKGDRYEKLLNEAAILLVDTAHPDREALVSRFRWQLQSRQLTLD